MFCVCKMLENLLANSPEVGIYKRKQESNKTRKQELDQESDQEKTITVKKKGKKTHSRPRKRTIKRKTFFLFFVTFLFSFINSHLRFLHNLDAYILRSLDDP